MPTNRAVPATRAAAVLAILLLIPGYLAIKNRPSFGKGEGNNIAAGSGPAAKPDARQVREDFGKLPLNFEPNVGQTDARVKFLARANGYMVFLSPEEAVLEIHAGGREAKLEAPQMQTAAVAMKFEGGRAAKLEGSGQLPGHVNYILGNDASKWHTNVNTYSQVRYAGVYPGVDLLFHGNGRQLEYDFVVSAGADPSKIDLKIAGAKSIRVEKSGDAVLETRLGGVELKRPLVYQEANGQRKEVAGGYVLKNGDELRFEVGRYNHNEALVIDPVLAYSTYLGGSAADYADAVAADASGNVYVAGITLSTDFPTANAFIAVNPNGGGGGTSYTGFVTKLDPTGKILVYSTYLGGTTPIRGTVAQDFCNGIAVDTLGQAYVVGQTFDTNYPVTSTAFETIQQSRANSAFVTVFNPAGSALVYSSYMGAEMGGISALAVGVAVDNVGGAYVTGRTTSFNFPVTPGAFQTTFNGIAASPWVAKFNTISAGVASVVYSSFLGGSGNPTSGVDDNSYGVAVDAAGDAYVVGSTVSTNFPTVNAYQGTLLGTENAFVSEVNPTGAALVYSTYLGGTGTDNGLAISVDSSASAYAAGSTTSTNFPVTAGAFQSTLKGTNNAFVTKFAPGGATLSYSTYLGGTNGDIPNAITLDSLGDAYVAGQTFSIDFPITLNAFQSVNLAATTGTGNGFISQFNPTGTALLFSSYIGGSGNPGLRIGDQVYGVALDAQSNIYLAGMTSSTNFPVVNALQATLNGTEDAFVTEVSNSVTVTPSTLAFGNIVQGSTSTAMNLTVMNNTSAAITTSVTISGANASDFAATNGCGASLGSGANCTVTVTFTPSILGAESASLQVVTNAPANPAPVALTGTGVMATPTADLSVTSLTFPSQVVTTTSAAMNVTLTNNGGSVLNITGFTFLGTNPNDFAQSNTCGTSVNPGANCVISVTFTPSIVGAESATLSIADNAANSPQTVALTGTGASGTPQAVFTPTSLTFASQILNTTSAAMTVMLSNPGTGPLSITTIATTGANGADFGQTNTCGSSVGIGGSCMISVTFTPTAVGARAGAVSVTDNAAGSPQNVALSGKGGNVTPPVTITPQ